MTEQPLVTIVTVTFNLLNANRTEYFKRCIESVHNQTYKNIEHIIIDGASKDGTIDLIQEYVDKGWVKCFSEPDNGIFDAMNKGLNKANGEYIEFLNSDDYFCCNNAIEMSINMLLENNGDIIASAHNVVKDDAIVIANVDHGWSKMTFGTCPNHQTVFYKTELLKKYGGYDTDYLDADNISFLAFKKNNAKFLFNNVPIVNFQAAGNSASINRQIADEQFISYFISNIAVNTTYTKEDVYSLYGTKFVNLPIDKAIKLGAKLAYYNPESVEQFFSILFHYKELNKPIIKNETVKKVVKQTIVNEVNTKSAIKYLISKIFSVKNEYRENKKHKVITIFGIKIKLKLKIKEENK